MTPMTFVFQFCDSLVKGEQFPLQILNFVLNQRTPRGIFIDGLSLLCTRCWLVTVQDSLPLCGHGPSESRTRG
jgi:hypothetical protein